MKKVFIVMAKCGEGVVFDNQEDADFAMTGKNEKGSSYSSLADSFRDFYSDDELYMQTVEISP